MAIGKCTDVFRRIFLVWGGEKLMGGGVTWEYFSMEEFVMGEENYSSIILKKNNEKTNIKSFFN